MFDDLKEQLENFYDLSDDENKKISKEIIRRAKANKTKFGQYLADLDYGIDSPKEVIFEALSSDAREFEDVILREIKELINQAEAGNEDAEGYMSAIYWLADLKGMTDDFYRQSLDLYFKKLNSPSTDVREECRTAIFDIVDASNIKLTDNEVGKIQKMLYDKDFKIRVYTFSDLADAKLLPKGFKFSLFDKIRGRLKGYSKLMKNDGGYKKR